MSKSEVSLFLNKKNQGLVLGSKYRLPLKDSFQNLCMIAPTGLGKTRRFVVPNILNCVGSVVVTDPSGELYRLTSGHMKDRGYKIQVLSPHDIEYSLRFNPLKRLSKKQDLKRIAETLGQNMSLSSDPFWTISATHVIYVCLCALFGNDDEDLRHLGNVRTLVNSLNLDDKRVNSFMCNYLDKQDFNEYKAILANDEKVLSSILGSARVALDSWTDPDIVEFTAYDNIDIEALRKEKTIIYIIIPEHKVSYFSLVINLFYSTCFEYCKENSGLPVFFFLDEFGNIGKINNFENIITTSRKSNISISLILQDITQIETIYGKTAAQTIYSGGIINKMFLSGLDMPVCKAIEEILGKQTVYDFDVRGNRSGQTFSRPLMDADQIRRLDKSKCILISGSERPIKITMPSFDQYKPWLDCTKKSSAEIKTDFCKTHVRNLDF